jgi:hypothetical protein
VTRYRPVPGAAGRARGPLARETGARFRAVAMRASLLVAAGGVALGCDATIVGLDPVDGSVLDVITRVSTGQLSPAEQVLLDLLRPADGRRGDPSYIPQLDSLFDLVIADRSPAFAERAIEVRLQHEILIRDAWREIDAGNTGAGERGLLEARSVQTQLVAQRLGRVGALIYVAAVSRSLQHAFDRADSGMPRRSRSMLRSALDLRDDARAAIRNGRLPAAFDFASHAAGLANTLASGAQRD